MTLAIDVDSTWQRGCDLLRDGDLRDGVEVLWEYVLENPGNEWKYSALVEIANALVDLENYDGAIEVAQRAATMFPSFSDPFFIVAKAYWKIGQPRSALKTMVDGFRRRQPTDWPLPVNPDDGDLHPRRLYARLLVDVGWYYEAMQVANDGLNDFVGDEMFRVIMKDAMIGDARDRRYNL